MIWRAMRSSDLAAVIAIADQVHANYPEEQAVFAERLALYPPGCLVLMSKDRDIAGYVVSHPWLLNAPPALNAALGEIPQAASTYYIHDIALLPAGQGSGAASSVVSDLIRHAANTGMPNVSLVAVNASQRFWEKHGFRVVDDPALTAKLMSYDEQARYMVSGQCSLLS